MKIRKDFVTNSSSSSFICDICGRVESGWDISLDEAEMVSCIEGHYMCEDEINWEDIKRDAFYEELDKEVKCGNSKAIKLRARIDKAEAADDTEEVNCLIEDHFNDYIDECDLRYDIPEHLCPVCNHDIITDNEFINYIIKVTGKTRDQLMKEAKEYYKSKM